MDKTHQARLYEEQMGADALARQKRAAAPRCRSCDRPIIWVTTERGKKMPLDYDPHEGGNMLLHPGGRATSTTPGGPATMPTGVTLHYSHFATCPNADKHRSKR